MPPHVRAATAGPIPGSGRTPRAPGRARARPPRSSERRMRLRHRAIGEPEQHGEQVAEHVALLAPERKVDEAQVEVAVARALAHVVHRAGARAGTRAISRENGIEQLVEVLAGRRGVRQRVQALDLVPQRVAVEHEARARHDVRPVARLVLLQQGEALVLLAQQPGRSPAAPCRCSRARRPAVRGTPVEEVHARAATTASRRCSRGTRNRLRGCSGRRTSGSARWAPGGGQASAGRRGLALQASGAAERHAESAHGGVPGEHRAVAARARPARPAWRPGCRGRRGCAPAGAAPAVRHSSISPASSAGGCIVVGVHANRGSRAAARRPQRSATDARWKWQAQGPWRSGKLRRAGTVSRSPLLSSCLCGRIEIEYSSRQPERREQARLPAGACLAALVLRLTAGRPLMTSRSSHAGASQGSGRRVSPHAWAPNGRHARPLAQLGEQARRDGDDATGSRVAPREGDDALRMQRPPPSRRHSHPRSNTSALRAARLASAAQIRNSLQRPSSGLSQHRAQLRHALARAAAPAAA